ALALGRDRAVPSPKRLGDLPNGVTITQWAVPLGLAAGKLGETGRGLPVGLAHRQRDLSHRQLVLILGVSCCNLRFGKKGKLSPRYVGPYQILKRVGKVAYELDLPNKLASVHLVFHVSMLKKCIGDLTSIIPLEGLGVDESRSYEEVPVEILDQQVKRLRNKEIASVKFLWRNHLVEGATWEAEADMKSRYPHLFPSTPSQA
ncbi:hypothetical protein MTR67_007123, partial [Solanum verrucosum]